MWQNPKLLVHVLTSLLVHGFALFIVLSIPIYAGGKSAKFITQEAHNFNDSPGIRIVELYSVPSGMQKRSQKNIKDKIPDKPAIEIKRILSTGENLPKKSEKINRKEAVSEQSVSVREILDITDSASTANKPIINVPSEIRESDSILSVPKSKTAGDSSGEVAAVREIMELKPEAGFLPGYSSMDEPKPDHQSRTVKTGETGVSDLPELTEPVRDKEDRKIPDNNSGLADLEQVPGPDFENIASEQTISAKESLSADKESRETAKTVEPDDEGGLEPQISPKSELIAAAEAKPVEPSSFDAKEKTGAVESLGATPVPPPAPSSINAPDQSLIETSTPEKELTYKEENIAEIKDSPGIVLIPRTEIAVNEAVAERLSENTVQTNTKVSATEAVKRGITVKQVKSITERKNETTGQTAAKSVPKIKEPPPEKLHEPTRAADIRRALEPFVKNPAELFFTGRISDGWKDKEERKRVPAIPDRRLAGDIRRALKPFLDTSLEKPAVQKGTYSPLHMENKEISRKNEAEKTHSTKPGSPVKPEEQLAAMTQSDVPAKKQATAVLTTPAAGSDPPKRTFPELEHIMKGLDNQVTFSPASDLLQSVRREPIPSIAEVKPVVTETINKPGIIKTEPGKVLRQEENQDQNKKEERENLLKEFIEKIPLFTENEEHGNIFGIGPLTGKKHKAPIAEEKHENETAALSILSGSDERPAPGIPVPASMLMKDITIELILPEGEEDVRIEKQLLMRELPVRGRKRGQNDRMPVKFDEGTENGGASGGVTQKFSVANADKGIYTLVIKNPYDRDYKIDVFFRLYDGGPKRRVKEYKADKIPARGELNYKFILPHAIFWDDDDYFSGSIESSGTITKFNDETGLVWEEEKK
jgi:hypothetical protein